MHYIYSKLLALNFLSTFCNKIEHHHLRGVHYLEFITTQRLVYSNITVNITEYL